MIDADKLDLLIRRVLYIHKARMGCSGALEELCTFLWPAHGDPRQEIVAYCPNCLKNLTRDDVGTGFYRGHACFCPLCHKGHLDWLKDPPPDPGLLEKK